jgi:hypothetical protein
MYVEWVNPTLRVFCKEGEKFNYENHHLPNKEQYHRTTSEEQ